MNASTRREVLSLYRTLLKFGRTWEARESSLTQQHRQHIVDETRTKFRENKNVTDEHQIRKLISEGEKRIEIALHYGVPYERPQYLAPQTGYSPRSTSTCDGSANGRISRRIRHSEETGLNWSGLDENVRHLCRRILAGARVSDALCQSAVSSLAPDNYSSLASLFLSPVLQKYSPKVSFLRAVLKQLLKYVPSDFSDDLYECLGDLLAVEEKSFSYRIYVSEDGTRTIAIIKEATAQLSCGTTGLSVWQASCDLANLLYHIGDLPENILELGAGCGLSGIVAAASSTSSTVVLTDLDHNVLKRLNENVDIAKLNDYVRVQHLDWRNFSVNDLNPVPDLIIAADVVYDTSILADLSNVIAECLKSGNEHCQAIIASTLRDPDTLKQFRKALEKRNLEIVEEFRYHDGRFLFDDGAEVSYPSLFPYFSTLDTSTVFYRIRVSNILWDLGVQ